MTIIFRNGCFHLVDENDRLIDAFRTIDKAWAALKKLRAEKLRAETH